MKSLIISLIFMLICMLPWCLYFDYSVDCLTFSEKIIKEAVVLVNAEEYDNAMEKLEIFTDEWLKYKNYALYFINRQLISEVDSTIAKSKYYIKAADKSNSSGELASLSEQLIYLLQSETISMATVL